MAPRVASLLLIIICLFNRRTQVAGDCENVTTLSTQIDSLLAMQDRDVPPQASMTVNVRLDVRHATVNERDTSMRVLADLTIKWQDKRLSWNATEWGCSNWLISAERIWLPDVAVLEGTVTNAGDYSLRARISSDGSVSWIKRFDISTPISLNLENWPKDTQTCSLVFGSRFHTANELHLSLDESVYSLVFDADSWNLLSVTGKPGLWKRDDEQTVVLIWSVTLQRRAPAHTLAATTVLTSALLLLVAGSALTPASRPPLTAAAALLGTIWMMGTVGRLPGAESSPRILALVSAMTVLAVVSCALSALVVRVPSWTYGPPQHLRVLLSKLSAVCNLTPHPDSVSSEKSATWAATARLLDQIHLLMLYFTIIVIAAISFL